MKQLCTPFIWDWYPPIVEIPLNQPVMWVQVSEKVFWEDTCCQTSKYKEEKHLYKNQNSQNYCIFMRSS